MSDEVSEHPLYRLFEAVDRQGPGSEDDTIRAWTSLTPPRQARVVDLGSGTGAASRALLTSTDARVTALDQHGPFLAQLTAWAQRRGVEDRLSCVVGDMAEPPFADGSFDIVWSEGAAYAIGFENALRRWRLLLTDGGQAAVSELVWRTSSPPEPAVAFFAQEYPDMALAEERVAMAVSCGYQRVDDFMVSGPGWWESYYAPLLAQLARIEAESPDDDGVRAVAKAVRAEAQIYREHGDSFGYLFLALKKRD